MSEDAGFYEGSPVIVGDWPEHWKHGWVYDLETLRMNVRPPPGIYKHPWDGMQMHTPRRVPGHGYPPDPARFLTCSGASNKLTIITGVG